MNRRRTVIAAGSLVLLMTAQSGRAAALDLPETLRQVAAGNPMLTARTAMVEAARRRATAAGAWPSPMIEAGVINVPTDGSFDTDPMTMKMLGITQTVPVFGANGLARRSATAGWSAEQAAAEQTLFEVMGMAWESYCDAYYATELVKLVSSHRAIADQVVQSVRIRYQTGQGRLEDVLRSQARQGMTEVDLAMFRAEELGARARLDALRGRAPGAAPDSLAPPPDTAIVGAVDDWLAALDQDHPRVRGGVARTERYQLAAGAMRRRQWPDLELRYEYGWREPIAGLHEQDDMFTATVGFMLPIFGTMRAEASEMDAMARASDAERRAAELELRAEVVTAHAAAIGSRWRASLLADTVIVQQRKALEASWSAYRAGGGDMWRVFESSHALYDEEVALLRARKDFAHAAARLVALTGRTDLLGIAAPGRSER